MPLSDIQLRNLKPKEKSYKVSDFEGLFVLINVSGSKSWRFKYRVDGKEKLLVIGDYPAATVRQIERLDKAMQAEFEVLEERRQRSWEEVKRGVALAVAAEQFFAPDNLVAISKWATANGPTFGIREFKVRGDKVCPKGPGEWHNFTTPRIDVPNGLRKYLPQ